MSELMVLEKILPMVGVLVCVFAFGGLMFGKGVVSQVAECLALPALLLGVLLLSMGLVPILGTAAKKNQGMPAARVGLPEKSLEWCGCVTLQPKGMEGME